MILWSKQTGKEVIGMIKGYSIDIDTNGKEIDEDFLFDVIANALRLERIDLIGLQHQANWENMSDYERNIQVY